MEVDIPLQTDEGNPLWVHLVINFNFSDAAKAKPAAALSMPDPTKRVTFDDSGVEKTKKGILRKFAQKLRGNSPMKARSASEEKEEERLQKHMSLPTNLKVSPVTAAFEQEAKKEEQPEQPKRKRVFELPVAEGKLELKEDVKPEDSSAEDTSYVSVKGYMDDYMQKLGKQALSLDHINRCQKFIFKLYKSIYGKEYDRRVTDSEGTQLYEYVASQALPLFEMLKNSANWR